MNKLLPHCFKKVGIYVAPIGLFLWLSMQLGWISEIFRTLGIVEGKLINIFVASFGLFFFLFGIYAISFSKEKIEDELVRKIRVESFRVAALVQIIFITCGIIFIGFLKNPPKDAGMLLFFIAAVLLFWLTYIIRFNYVLYALISSDEE